MGEALPVAAEALTKVFGADEDEALRLLREGVGKAELRERTGAVVGVHDASFTVEAGEIFVLMGLSGSGKSTLVRMLNRLIEPSAGRVRVGEREITAMGRSELLALRRSDLAMVFQSFALLPHQTVLENAEFGLEVARVPRRERRRRARRALEQVGLADYASSRPEELSGGMQQRVGLARALATDPSILLMDEAFSALDPLIRTEMQDELLRLQEEKPRTVVFISHDLDEAMRIGDRLGIMDEGRILQVGTPRAILREPANDRVRTFFREVDASRVFRAGEFAEAAEPTLSPEAADLAAARELLARSEAAYGFAVDAEGRLRGVVSLRSLERARAAGKTALEEAFLPDLPRVEEASPLRAAIHPAAASAAPLPVVDAEGRLRGMLTAASLLRALDRAT